MRERDREIERERERVCVRMHACMRACVSCVLLRDTVREKGKGCLYGVTTMSRLLKTIGLFCRI